MYEPSTLLILQRNSGLHASRFKPCLVRGFDVRKGKHNIISGSETGLITEFLEPFLKFAVTAVGSIYAVQVRFVYDTSHGWKDIYISQAMTLEELREINDHLKQLSAQFPVRKGQE